MRTFEEKPNEWADWGEQDIRDAGQDIFYSIIGDGITAGGKASNVWVWHWHVPTNGEPRWQLSGCGLHTVLQVEPLTLDPSLACDDGCTSHGWIKNGQWTSA
jgi:hypothetical protein